MCDHTSQMKFLRDLIANFRFNLKDISSVFLKAFRENIYHIRRLRMGFVILLVALICFLPAIQPYGAVLGSWFFLAVMTSLLSRWIQCITPNCFSRNYLYPAWSILFDFLRLNTFAGRVRWLLCKADLDWLTRKIVYRDSLYLYICFTRIARSRSIGEIA